MAPPVVARTVVYAGMVTVHFRTYTSAYVPLNGAWGFNQNSYAPMEWHGFINGSVPTGLWARLFDVNTGQTTLQVGDNSLAHDSAVQVPSNWQNNALSGWAVGSIGEVNPSVYAYPMIPGTSHIYNVFAPNAGVHLIGTVNTRFPQSGLGANMPAAAYQVQGSGIRTLNPYYYLTRNGSVTYLGNGVLDLAISNLSHFSEGAVVHNGLSYVKGGNPADITDRVQLLATDWIASATKYAITFENPPGGVNIDDLMTQHATAVQTCERGFIHIDKSTIVVGGVTLNGFGVFIAPDYSSYQLIQLIPSDATSQTWLANIGDYSAKIDPSNALWMKNANIHDTLFVSAAPVLRSLPIFPPIPLEPLFDADPVVQMMRGQ